MKFEGIYVPLVTTFRDDFTIDYGAWGEAIDFQLDNGTHAIIVGGSTGEFFSLTVEERIEQLHFAAERIAGRAQLLAGINDMLPANTFSLAQAARDAGADALLVAAPPYSLPGQAELVEHCRQIDKIAQLPIMLYNYPGRTGVNMEREFLDQVMAIGNVQAIKESSGDADRVQMLASNYPQLQLSAGAEDQVLEFFAWGATSWVSVIANFLPSEAVRFWEVCARDGDFVTGRQVMAALLPLMYCLERSGKFIQSVKQACATMGRPAGPSRPPFLPLDEAARNDVGDIVQKAQAELAGLLPKA